MAKEKEVPGRMNDVWDHSGQTLFDASGMTESQFNATERMVDKTCCSKDKHSETMEGWCDVMSKKEMAMLIRYYRHKAVIPQREKSFSSFFEKLFSEDESNKPTRENDVYDLSNVESKDLKKILGFDEVDISLLVDHLNRKIQEVGEGNSLHLAKIIQSNTTHKEASVLYALEMAKQIQEGDMRSFIKKLWDGGKEE